MTHDQLRRQIRAELQAARCRDGDHSGVRYFNDARELDARMTAAGHPPSHPTTWSAQYAQCLKTGISANLSDSAAPGDTEVSP